MSIDGSVIIPTRSRPAKAAACVAALAGQTREPDRFEQHLPRKRWMWRAGLRAPAAGPSSARIDWPHAAERREHVP